MFSAALRIILSFQNPRELTAGVDQNVIDYSVSFNGQATLTNCSNTSSSNCLYVRPPTTTLSTVSIAARNVIGRGLERNCSFPSGAIGESVHRSTLSSSPGPFLVFQCFTSVGH